MEVSKKTKNGGFASPFWTDLFDSDRLIDRWPFIEPAFTSPLANVIENGKSFKIELAVPGFSKNDFQVELDENLLSISANKEEEIQENDERYTRKEFRCASFERTFTLPDNCDAKQIEASYSDGILSLVLPKKESKNGHIKRVIPIS